MGIARLSASTSVVMGLLGVSKTVTSCDDTSNDTVNDSVSNHVEYGTAPLDIVCIMRSCTTTSILSTVVASCQLSDLLLQAAIEKIIIIH